MTRNSVVSTPRGEALAEWLADSLERIAKYGPGSSLEKSLLVEAQLHVAMWSGLVDKHTLRLSDLGREWLASYFDQWERRDVEQARACVRERRDRVLINAVG